MSALGEGNPDKEMVKASPGTTAIRGPVRGARGNCCILGKKMDLKGILKRRNVNQKRKRPAAARKIHISKWFRLIWMASLVQVSVGFPGSTTLKCFTCTDQCQDLVLIYNKTDFRLYGRDPNEPFPACSGPATPTGNNSCFVCNDTSKIQIYCPVEHVEELEVEGRGHTLNISSGCVPSQTQGQEHVGYIIAAVLIVLLLVGGLICCFAAKRGRADEGPQRTTV